MVTVGTAVLDGFNHRQALDYAPAHTVTLNIFTQVTDFLTCPYLAQRYIVQSCHNTLNAYLLKHGKCNLILLAKPTPCSFHIKFG